MRARRKSAEVSLATLRETIELAQSLAQDLGAETSASHGELIEALMVARIAALRLAAERARTRMSARP